jgi:NADH-ubiquinone oxidoreductase chain 5
LTFPCTYLHTYFFFNAFKFISIDIRHLKTQCSKVFNMLEFTWLYSLTIIMLIVVTFVSSLVHIYSISYMCEDPHSPVKNAF